MRRGVRASLTGAVVVALLALSPAAALAQGVAAGPTVSAGPAATSSASASAQPTGTATGTDPSTTTGPTATAGTGGVDVAASVGVTESADLRIAPGRSLFMTGNVRVLSGHLSYLAFTMTLPPGVTYLPSRSPGDETLTFCVPATGGRSITCRAVVPDEGSRWELRMQVGADVPAGTELPFTIVADTGSAVDVNPRNNTATTSLSVDPGSDWGMKWTAPKGRVATGVPVRTDLVMTNYGPEAGMQAAYLPITLDAFPNGWHIVTEDPRCWSDSGYLYCEILKPQAPDTSTTFSFTWKFDANLAGRTMEIPASLGSSTVRDPNPSDDHSLLRIVIAGRGAGTAAGGTSSTGGGATTAGNGGALAATGSDVAPYATLGAIVLLLGVLLVRRARRAAFTQHDS